MLLFFGENLKHGFGRTKSSYLDGIAVADGIASAIIVTLSSVTLAAGLMHQLLLSLHREIRQGEVGGFGVCPECIVHFSSVLETIETVGVGVGAEGVLSKCVVDRSRLLKKWPGNRFVRAWKLPCSTEMN